jgi:two-component system cell cycle response regulator DivK
MRALSRREKRPVSVLIVDDVEDVRDMYVGYLRFNGLRADSACNGKEALERVRSAAPDVVVLDLGMPGMTGWEVLRALKRQRPAYLGGIVILTGFPGLFATGDALDCRADAYLTKPCLPLDLLREVRRVASISRDRARTR